RRCKHSLPMSAPTKNLSRHLRVNRDFLDRALAAVTRYSFRLTHTSAEALGLIRSHATEPAATAPLSAAMTRSSHDMVPRLLRGICETAAAPEFDLSAGAIVSVPVAVTAVTAAGDASLVSVPCASAAR